MVTLGTELEQLISDFCAVVAHITDRSRLQEKADSFLSRFPEQLRVDIASRLHRANPFYLPQIADDADFAEIDDGFLDRSLLTAELAVRRNNVARILVACAPKSASTFIAGALSNALNLEFASLIHNFPNVALGEHHQLFLREQEIDVLAVIRTGFKPHGYVAQHHTRCTPYLCNQLASAGIMTIVSYRNVCDSIISLDDMCMKDRLKSAEPEAQYFRDGLPKSYHRMDRDERLLLQAGKMAHWYINFYVSWKQCEAMDLIRPLWISYEDDFHGDRSLLAGRVAQFLALGPNEQARLKAEFEAEVEAGARRLNKGVVGRGQSMPTQARELIESVARFYSHEGVDLSPIL
jgi:hypothetical protein